MNAHRRGVEVRSTYIRLTCVHRYHGTLDDIRGWFRFPLLLNIFADGAAEWLARFGWLSGLLNSIVLSAFPPLEIRGWGGNGWINSIASTVCLIAPCALPPNLSHTNEHPSDGVVSLRFHLGRKDGTGGK